MSEKSKNIIIISLIAVIFILIIGLVYLYLKNEHLEDRYDDLKDLYEYTYNNNDNTSNNNPENTDESNNKTRDEILNIVLKDLNITRQDITDLDIELEYKLKYNKRVYEVSFDYKLFEYEYYLEPTTGKILDSYKSLS